MVINRHPKNGELVKINPDFKRELLPEIKKGWRYFEIWEDLSVIYRVKYNGYGSLTLIPINKRKDEITQVGIIDTGEYNGVGGVPMFIFSVEPSKEDLKFCQCEATSYRQVPLFSTIVKVCQECGKDKKE